MDNTHTVPIVDGAMPEPTSTALRAYLARILGFGSSTIVDRGIRVLRLATNERVPLVLVGDGDLTAIARRLHALTTMTRSAPFVVCDPRRTTTTASVRTQQSERTFRDSLRVAGHAGAVCIRWQRRPRDFASALAECRASGAMGPMIAVCTDQVVPQMLLEPLVIPSLATRRFHLDRIIAKFVDDAFTEHDVPRRTLAQTDLAWLGKHAHTLAEIDLATRRLVAIRMSPSVNQAAQRLGMSWVALSNWMKHWIIDP